MTIPAARLQDVRLATLRYDEPVVSVLVEALQAHYGVIYGGPDETPVDPDEFAPPGGSFVLASAAGEPAGCAGIRRHDPVTAELKRMFVLDSFRGVGLGRLLLDEVERQARALGYTRMVLETGSVQAQAVGLYRSAGYEPIPGFGIYAATACNLCLVKPLG